MVRTRIRATLTGILMGLVLLVIITQVIFQLVFRATFISPGPGWDCWPTWDYKAVCTDPTGRKF